MEDLLKHLEAYLHKHEIETQCNRASNRSVGFTQGFRHCINVVQDWLFNHPGAGEEE